MMEHGARAPMHTMIQRKRKRCVSMTEVVSCDKKEETVVSPWNKFVLDVLNSMIIRTHLLLPPWTLFVNDYQQTYLQGSSRYCHLTPMRRIRSLSLSC